jgi:energy-coupling factor transporter ATP-binding protein EcfA2
MYVSQIRIGNFKRIAATEVPLTPITVLVGGNNSGKSGVLQAAHFAVNLVQAIVVEGAATLAPENLRYQPTADVLELGHGERLAVEGPPVEITFHVRSEPSVDDDRAFTVRLSRSAGATVTVDLDEDQPTTDRLADLEQPFSIYVPGLAGVPLREEYRSDAVVSNAIARGDANLYLRNILLRISRDPARLEAFNEALQDVLPGAKLVVNFEESLHATIDVRIEDGTLSTPLDGVGTGVLQYVQIVAYVLQYRPALLLLDEPDAHLHPNNQRVTANLLKKITSSTPTQVVLATHSRTLLDAMEHVELASVVWMEGGVVQAENDMDRISMLMALGALEGAERFYSTDCKSVVLTEDEDTRPLEILLESNGIDPQHVLIHSYKGSSKLQAAFEVAKFIQTLKPGVSVLIHRDRDFMTDEEIGWLREKCDKGTRDVDLFVTSGSDVEHYFTNIQHLADKLGITAEEAEALVNELLEEHKLALYESLRSKRDDLMWLYKGRDESPPSPKALARGNALSREHALGKTLLGMVVTKLSGRYPSPKAMLMQAGPGLEDPALKALSAKYGGQPAPAEVGHGA